VVLFCRPIVNNDEINFAPKKLAKRRVQLEPAPLDIKTPLLHRSNAMDFTPFIIRTCKAPSPKHVFTCPKCFNPSSSPYHDFTCDKCFALRYNDYDELSQ
jgi:hypothetical protein